MNQEPGTRNLPLLFMQNCKVQCKDLTPILQEPLRTQCLLTFAAEFLRLTQGVAEWYIRVAF